MFRPTVAIIRFITDLRGSHISAVTAAHYPATDPYLNPFSQPHFVASSYNYSKYAVYQNVSV